MTVKQEVARFKVWLLVWIYIASSLVVAATWPILWVWVFQAVAGLGLVAFAGLSLHLFDS